MAYKKWVVGAVLLLASVYLRETISARLTLSMLDDNQKAAMKDFRAAVLKDAPHDYMKEESYLLRWLSAKNFNVPDATKLFKENLKWREEEKVDTVLDEDWSDYEKRYPYQLTVNKESRPVLYYHYGAWDVNEQIKSGDFSKLTRYVTVKLLEETERRLHAIKKETKNEDINQYDVIVDLGRYGSDKNCLSCVQFYIDAARRSEAHYTGASEKAYLINAPTFFESTWALISRAFMMERTRNSIQVLGGRDSYEPVLLARINKEQMPIIVD